MLLWFAKVIWYNFFRGNGESNGRSVRDFTYYYVFLVFMHPLKIFKEKDKILQLIENFEGKTYGLAVNYNIPESVDTRSILVCKI